MKPISVLLAWFTLSNKKNQLCLKRPLSVEQLLYRSSGLSVLFFGSRASKSAWELLVSRHRLSMLFPTFSLLQMLGIVSTTSHLGILSSSPFQDGILTLVKKSLHSFSFSRTWTSTIVLDSMLKVSKVYRGYKVTQKVRKKKVVSQLLLSYFLFERL